LRNRDLRRLLHPDSDSAEPAHRRRLAARVGRQLRLLHAHGLIRKLSKTHRYTLTPKGHQLTAALSAARNATLKQLLRELP
jgi:DNA-binding IclR family transcriptional regulator